MGDLVWVMVADPRMLRDPVVLRLEMTWVVEVEAEVP